MLTAPRTRMTSGANTSMKGIVPGAFVISLDLELFWGMRDVDSIERYGGNVIGARKALPRMIEVFERHGINATFATLGLLFFDSKEQLLTALPGAKPSYADPYLSPYNGYLDHIGQNEASDPFHFGASLIRLMQQYPHHEIGCHTFSHLYCLEPGQTQREFAADLQAAITAAKKFNLRMESFVFPANQVNPAYLESCRELGIVAYRGNEPNWLNKARPKAQDRKLLRAIRLLDTWINITGHNCHVLPRAVDGTPVNIPASRFLRPWNKRTRLLDGIRLRRITKAMDHAARTGTLFHLWWHPHNFGANLEKNFAFLEQILQHFNTLQRSHGLRSMTMKEVAEEALRTGNHAQ